MELILPGDAGDFRVKGEIVRSQRTSWGEDSLAVRFKTDTAQEAETLQAYIEALVSDAADAKKR